MKLVIIGAGPGGYETALKARKSGFEVCLIEAGEVGGTCLNAGCIPTKAWCRSAEIVEEIRKSLEFGIEAGEPAPDFAKICERKDNIVSQLRGNVETMLHTAGVEIVRGRAEFRDARTIAVGDVEFSADYVIIATGSKPALPGIPGIGLHGVLDSTSLLNLRELPGHLCIIGGGVIGLEFASIFKSLGSEVTVVEFCREILPKFDGDIAKRLRQSLSKRGISFSLQSQVKSIEEEDGKLRVTWEKKGEISSVLSDNVLAAVGRHPDTASLNPAAAGIATTERGAIATDEDMRTNVPWIFAIGDVNGRQLLAHAAVAQGERALNAICSDISGKDPDNASACNKNLPDLSVMPSAVFTMPEAAAVGLTEDECKEKGIACSVRKSFFRANGKALCLGETEGLCKTVIAPSGAILGCHILGPHASDLVQEVSALMSAGAGYDALCRTIHIHPTLSEIFDI